MKEIKINFKKISGQQIKIIVGYLKKGKVIVCPTDTIYGLSCLATNKKAINKIRKIKDIAKKKPLIILVSSFAMAEKYCLINQKQRKILKSIWPGPVTAILESKNMLPGELSGDQESMAIRLPKSPFLSKIIDRVKLPLVSTSLNKRNDQPLDEAERAEIDQYFTKYKPDLIINAGKSSAKRASKIIDLRDLKNLKIIRE